MSIVLGIDTATRVAAGVARVGDDAAPGEILASRFVPGATSHAEQLMPQVEESLAAAGLALGDVDAVAVGLGPGPFTGLRVGIVTARVLAAALRVPLRGVCSLDVVAQAALADEPHAAGLVATIDARRKELYWARYDVADGLAVRVGDPEVTAPEALPTGLPVVGPGRLARPDLFGDASAPGVDAGLLAAIAHLLPDAGSTPLYLRRPDATEPSRRKSALTAGEGRR